MLACLFVCLFACLFVCLLACLFVQGFLKKLRSWNIIGSTREEGVAKCGM